MDSEVKGYGRLNEVESRFFLSLVVLSTVL